ncbi:hypothetical protein JCM19274_5233 [Algibacter lectus]|uniref:Uncharacterized protein n=1 Tax=Algibacter lectus TaxID=221126 RepID=A0A090WKE8_9FLAO|nr:hypothetical protein JCM19274_5233 [Algibacter lectus]
MRHIKFTVVCLFSVLSIYGQNSKNPPLETANPQAQHKW